ncbi:hypothetical protein ACYF6T_20950 [Streptomyces sp. 7R007]
MNGVFPPEPVGPDDGHDVAPGATHAVAASHATSEVTRLLSAGAHTDPPFAKAVVSELVDNRQRFAAPAYGYDAATVLGHALAARERRRRRTVAVAVCIAQWLAFGVVGGATSLGATAFWITSVIGVWGVWAACFVERLVVRQVLLVHLGRRRHPGAPVGFTGVAPVVQPGDVETYREIRREQDASAGVVYYSGYAPFVGAGRPVRRWSFACLLDGVDEDPSSRLPGSTVTRPPRRPAGEFTAEELTSHLERRLRSDLLTEVVAEDHRLRGLEVSRRFYAKAISRQPPDPAQRIDEFTRARSVSDDHYAAGREYLMVRVGSWAQELGTSVFLNVDLKGRMLYTQFHAYRLLPIKAGFHHVDALPDRITSATVWGLAGKAVGDTLGGIVDGLGWTVGLPLKLYHALRDTDRSPKAAQADHVDEASGLVDWGARVSVRELGAADGFRHFFQEMDDEKFVKIIERRTLEVILEFLEKHGVDTTEYRAFQSQALNVGILQTGGGTIVSNGVTSVGTASQATGDGHTDRRKPPA